MPLGDKPDTFLASADRDTVYGVGGGYLFATQFFTRTSFLPERTNFLPARVQ